MRGLVPEQLDEELARATGRAYVAGGRGDHRRGRSRHAAQLARHGRRLRGRRHRGRRRRDPDRAGLDRPALLRLRAPRSPRRDVHREPQPGAVQRHQDVPRRRQPDRDGHGPGRDPGRGRQRGTASRRSARARSRARRPRGVRRPPAQRWRRWPAAGSRSSSTPATAWPGTPAPPCSAASATSRSRSSRCTSSSTARSRTTRPTRSTPPTCVDLQRRVLAEGADIGLAFDGDADRCFLVDERGEAVSPSTLTALIAARELAKEPGATVIHNLITSRAVPEIVTELGGTPVRTRVGHSFIKARMAETEAIFGGEHSGHFYFRDFWRADSGMLAALHALAALAETDVPLSELLGHLRAVRRQRRDQLHRRRPGARSRPPSRRRTPDATESPPTPSTGSPSATRTGGSTSVRPTPSRCCGSTPRAGTGPPWPRSATPSSRSSGATR